MSDHGKHMKADYNVVQFSHDQHADQVVDLWTNVFGYDSARNDPRLSIRNKESVSDNLFFIAESNTREVVGTVMGGYDGHRGWIYSLAVRPEFQRQGIGKLLMMHVEGALKNLGCIKINLQIMEGNDPVQEFYNALGYAVEKRISMGKEISENIR